MTESEERSLRQRAIEHIAEVRRKLNPQTSEHIAHAARENADHELRAYAEYVGWRQLKGLQEDAGHAQYRPTRSGHNNASGRYRALGSILEMRYSLNGLSMTLGELTVPELGLVVAAYEARAADLAAECDRLKVIFEAAKAKGVEQVKQLGAKRVEALYRGEGANV
jgi:hypothetical protein